MFRELYEGISGIMRKNPNEELKNMDIIRNTKNIIPNTYKENVIGCFSFALDPATDYIVMNIKKGVPYNGIVSDVLFINGKVTKVFMFSLDMDNSKVQDAVETIQSICGLILVDYLTLITNKYDLKDVMGEVSLVDLLVHANIIIPYAIFKYNTNDIYIDTFKDFVIPIYKEAKDFSLSQEYFDAIDDMFEKESDLYNLFDNSLFIKYLNDDKRLQLNSNDATKKEFNDIESFLNDCVNEMFYNNVSLKDFPEQFREIIKTEYEKAIEREVRNLQEQDFKMTEEEIEYICNGYCRLTIENIITKYEELMKGEVDGDINTTDEIE